MPRVYVRSPFMLNYLSPCYTANDTRVGYGKVVTPRHSHAVTISHVEPTASIEAKRYMAKRLAFNAAKVAKSADVVMSESAELFNF